MYDKSLDSSVIEYTHNLDRQIAAYHPPGFSTTMTIDAADNLYVQSESAGGFSENVVSYRYGSTKVDHTYGIFSGPPNEMLGISVRGSTLYTLLLAATYNMNHLIQCDIKGSRACRVANVAFVPFCGFTTADRDYVYAPNGYDDKLAYIPIGMSRYSNRHTIALPAGYHVIQGCIFHSYAADEVWVTLQGDSKPAVAAEIDLRGKVVKRTIGAGDLDLPNAAYYGNGFTP